MADITRTIGPKVVAQDIEANTLIGIKESIGQGIALAIAQATCPVSPPGHARPPTLKRLILLRRVNSDGRGRTGHVKGPLRQEGKQDKHTKCDETRSKVETKTTKHKRVLLETQTPS